MSYRSAKALALVLLIHTAAASDSPARLWTEARAQKGTHQFSTLFTAHDIPKYLATGAARTNAIQWCRDTGVTKVYLELYRDGFQADSNTLAEARDQFKSSGFEVSGCITPTQVGKKSTGWPIISCYTDDATQKRIQKIFEETARLFDEIMIDDFWFTDCSCAQCDQARLAQRVTIGSESFPVSANSWEAYRSELMLRVSQRCLLDAAKRVNPQVRLIIKYPQWYDRFHLSGYDVLRETDLFDRIWVGTESRDYRDPKWGGTVQYESFFIMRWLSGIGGAKCGGGWYDWLGTTEKTYLEQARQTILGGARESMLFCFGGLQSTTGPQNILTLRAHLPELLDAAREVRKRSITGIAAYKPGNSPPENEPRVFDFVGMLGFPLAPCHLFPTNAPAAFFSLHALKDPQFAIHFKKFVDTGKPVLITDGLAARLRSQFQSLPPNVIILPVKGDPKSILNISQDQLDELRRPLLKPFHLAFNAPPKVSLYLFEDGSWVAENFDSSSATVQFNANQISIPARDWTLHWRPASN